MTLPLIGLPEAAKLFPDGKVSPAMLRRQGELGRLTIYRIGNRVYTTAEAVGRMVEACRVQSHPPASGRESRGTTRRADSPTTAASTLSMAHAEQALATLTTPKPNARSRTI